MANVQNSGGDEKGAVNWGTVLQDLEKIAVNMPAIVAVVKQLVTILGGGVLAKGMPDLKCGTGDDCCSDPCAAIDCAVECQVHALCCSLQAKHCLESDSGDF